MTFLNLFKHLLPRARAWSITVKKSLQKFWDALTVIGDNFKYYADTWIYDAYFADRTELLDLWINEFGLSLSTTLTEEQRRDRLVARWAETGGQSPRYIQNAIQNAGFDIYVHEWWFPGYTILCGEPEAACGEPLAQCGQFGNDLYFGVPRAKNPFDYLRSTYLPKNSIFVECGEPLAECGEPQALCGNTGEKIGYPLVNKIDISIQNYTILCGEPVAECGESFAECGEFDKIITTQKDYAIPNDPRRWRYFAYFGAEIFPNLAEIPIARKDEFENLLLKLCPLQLWLGILVKYT